MAFDSLQLHKLSHFFIFFPPSPLLLCLCFLEVKIDKPVCVCVCVTSLCVGVVKAVSVTGVVLADSLVLNSSPFPPCNKHTHAHTQNICSARHRRWRDRDATSFLLHRPLRVYSYVLERGRGHSRANAYPLRAAHLFHTYVIIPISAISPNNNNNSQRDVSHEVICAVQTQCHSPSDRSNSSVRAGFHAVSRRMRNE